jgi:hypothetical protein
MGIQRETHRSLITRIRLLTIGLSGFGPITTAGSARWKWMQISTWAADARFLQRSVSFHGFPLYLLV